MRTTVTPIATRVSLGVARVACCVSVVLNASHFLIPRFTGYRHVSFDLSLEGFLVVLIWFVPYAANIIAARIVSANRICRIVLLIVTLIVCALRLLMSLTLFSFIAPYYFRPRVDGEGLGLATGMPIVVEFYIAIAQGVLSVLFIAFGFWHTRRMVTQPEHDR